MATWRRNHSQQTAFVLEGRSPFPTGPVSRALPTKKVFLDYDLTTSQRKDHARKSFLDLKAWETPQTRSPKISENWTIPELKNFPELLKRFGSDWKSIAAIMKTKTAIMVSCFTTSWHELPLILPRSCIITIVKSTRERLSMKSSLLELIQFVLSTQRS